MSRSDAVPGRIDPDENTRRLAAESLAEDDPTGWFERLYAEAEGGAAVVPWDREAPQQLLIGWAEARRPTGDGRALVVGAGYGRDAEYVQGLGFATVAFDVSPTAVEATRRRFPDSAVEYVTADLLDLPDAWRQGFDLVVESLTVQALPPALHDRAIAAVRATVAPGGTLVVIASGQPAGTAVEGPPWPLTPDEVEAFAGDGLVTVRLERVGDAAAPADPTWVWRSELRRPEA
jgi:protein-L-isoaspartate O-methyltransferase